MDDPRICTCSADPSAAQNKKHHSVIVFLGGFSYIVLLWMSASSVVSFSAVERATDLWTHFATMTRTTLQMFDKIQREMTSLWFLVLQIPGLAAGHRLVCTGLCTTPERPFKCANIGIVRLHARCMVCKIQFLRKGTIQAVCSCVRWPCVSEMATLCKCELSITQSDAARQIPCKRGCFYVRECGIITCWTDAFSIKWCFRSNLLQ